jgi:tetratricopeptide (TPR) repeat protein
MQKAIAHFKRAIELDPSYAPAYSGLADGYTARAYYGWAPPREEMPKARAAATQALEIDETLSEAHTALGGISNFYDWRWAEAERRYRRAIELNSSHATAHHWLAGLLIAVGRLDDGLAEIRQAQQLDPLSSIINASSAHYTYLAGEYGRAIELSLKALEIDSQFWMSRAILAVAYLQQSMPEQAVFQAQEVSRLLGSDPRAMWFVGYVYALGGRRDEALRIREELIRRSASEYISPYGMALCHIGLGDMERALAALKEAYDDRAGELVLLGVEPSWDPLRSDPRFQDLLRRIGFPED